MTIMQLPTWLTYPGSLVSLRFRPHDAGSGILLVVANPQGLASLVGAFLWLTSYSDHGAMSLSGLPFVRTEGPLALSIVMTLEEEPCQGRIVRVDKDREFEWHVYDDRLTAVAVALHRVAVSPEYVDWFDVNVSPASDATLRFEVTDVVEQIHDAT